MTGSVEANTVLDLISAITGTCLAAHEVYEAYGDANGLPNKFRTAATQLPLVCHTLELAEKNIKQGNVGDQALETAMPVLEQCKDSAASLKEIFDKALPVNEEPDRRDMACLNDLRLSDPCDDKTRIQETKGGLLQGAYRWILENDSFRQWRNEPQGRVLWIRGDPGKGKTMLLCGIIDELGPNTCLSYFFCQATNEQLNHATAVLRGLIYMLIQKRPTLISYVREKYDHAGKRLFEEINAWQALCKILTDMLADKQAANTILLVDALDECTSGLPELLQFICRPSGAKWS
ncbi:hypothetical protein SEUCBS140593_009949 [Sporothrix eucalyptigena]|uniref:NACHT domain-containing protein n=1 Tax=Sporothrix eucalyptigena TaxID=1812306 RepID=A0ABP0D0V7_9PEZI